MLSYIFTTDSYSVQAGETVSITRAQGLNVFGRFAENLLLLDLRNLNDSLVDEGKTPIPMVWSTIQEPTTI